MANNEENKQPIDKMTIGNISLLKWENINRKGKAFHSYSLVKKVTVFDDKDRRKFSGQLIVMNLLNRFDLRHVKAAITEMLDKEDAGEAD